MKKTIKYLIGVAIVLISLELLALLQSCTRIDPLTPPVGEDVDAITFAPSMSSTKGLLNSGDLNELYTRIQVYDYLSGFSGNINNTDITTDQTIKYFSHVISYDDNTTSYWPYWNPEGETGLGHTGAPDPTIAYPWTKSGIHSFFGWLVADGKTSPNTLVTSLFSPSFNEGNRVLTVPTTTLTTASEQFDFSYSDVVAVDAATRVTGTPVPLRLKHFFGAIGITITNNSKNDVIVYSVQLKNFPNRANATIDFSSNASATVDATYYELASTGAYAYWPNKIVNPLTLYNINDSRGGKVYDVSNSAVLAENGVPQYFLAWPMSYRYLDPTVENVDDEGVVTYTADSPLIEVKYGDLNSNASTASTFTYRFPKVNDPDATAAIIAGKKYSLDLSFADHQIIVSFSQLPWTYEEFPMAYEGDAISTTQLKFTEGTYVSAPKYTTPDGIRHDVIQLSPSSTAGQYIAKGTFKAYTPVNGVLTVGVSGNTEDFIVTLDSGLPTNGPGRGSESITIAPHRDGGQITLTVRPKGTPSSGSRIFLHFAVRNNGRDESADTEINRDEYMITIP